MSLTPASRQKETVDSVFYDGAVNGLLAFIPSMAAVGLAMRNPGFLKRTNWQSRTAMATMPALFTFALSAEYSLKHRMDQMAETSRHQEATVQWAEQQQSINKSMSAQEKERQLSQMYYESIQQSGVNIVPGDKLKFYHKVANYTAENPIKVLAGLAIPSVATIFMGRTGKEHLNFSIKLLHTRVFGQFATITILLGVMGFKDYMDRNGKFITEEQAQAKVQEMYNVRQGKMYELQKERREQQDRQDTIQQAHNADKKAVREQQQQQQQQNGNNKQNAINV